MKGFVISAPMTGSGKTTVTLGLLAALRNRGVAVQPFKIGPDFIDPGLHEIAAGVPSHNLDGWMLSRETNEWFFAQATNGKEIAVVEGVMGLYDGFDGKSEHGSTAEIAKWLGLPVVLVVDAHAMARSAAALVLGFQQFDADVKIAGVIFNRVGGQGHYRILVDAMPEVPVFGCLPANPAVEISERHLGLLTAPEVTMGKIRAIEEFLEKHLDIDRIVSSVGAVYDRTPFVESAKNARSQTAPTVRVAIAQDEAFSFYYHANRIALQEAGGSLVEFSPLRDHEVPDADFLYIGGGYPELYRRELAANTAMRRSIRRFIESGKKFYAECGGLMYLAESIDDAEMVGVIPAKIQMTSHLVDFGYCEIATTQQSILGPAGTIARGHQFHYSRCSSGGELYRVRQGPRDYCEGFVFPNGIASYIHLHFLSNPALARNMLNS
jgi:cobyrinic acid a,c-diamide synthase